MLALLDRAKANSAVARIVQILVAAAISTPANGALDLNVAPQVRLPVTFTFKDVVHVKRERLMLGQIATCTGTQSICEEAYGVDMGPAPDAGDHLYLPRSKLEKVLATEWPDAAVTVGGAMTVKIVPIVETITEDQIKMALAQWIEDHQPTKSDIRIQVKSVQLARPVKVTPGDYRLTFPFYDSEHAESWSRLDWVGSKFLGTKNVEVVRQVIGNNSEDRFYATIQCEASVQVPVTSQRVGRGTILRDRHLEMGWRPMTRTHQDYIRDKKQLVGKILGRSLRIGEGITRNQIKIPQIVKRGEMLQLTVNRSGLRIVSEVKAMANGGYGDTIFAMHTGTNKKMRVRIVAPGKAEAKF